jgi:hypothetical protein
MLLRLRLTKIDEFQLLTCVKHGLWGSRSARFKDWKPGDFLAFIVDKGLAGLARVSGEPFDSRRRIWDNALFPYRIPIEFLHIVPRDRRPPILGKIRDVLTSEWGPKYGWGILNQQPLSEANAEAIVEAIREQPNVLPEAQASLENLLEEARLQRESAKPVKQKPEKVAEPKAPAKPEDVGTTEEASAHTRAQAALIRLGRIANCSVWVASNDRNRMYQGRRLGSDCLAALPNMGLGEEAAKRISLIDALWIRQSAPMSAFEVETTTSVYSGLLRMSDLLAVVPALKMKLYLVAPKDRQHKVMAELARPTFQKIGLGEYCRFIAIEDLETLLSKVGGFAGHVQPSIVDSIAIEVEEEAEG